MTRETLTRGEGRQLLYGELSNIEKSRVHQVSPTAIRTSFLQQLHHPMRHMSADPNLEIEQDGDQMELEDKLLIGGLS
jgi:hypothetical protein